MNFPGVIQDIIGSYFHKCERNYFNGHALVRYTHLSLEQVLSIKQPMRLPLIRWCCIHDEPMPIREMECSEEVLAVMVECACIQRPMSYRIMEFVEHYITRVPESTFQTLDLRNIYLPKCIETQDTYRWFKKLGFVDDDFDVEKCILQNDDAEWLVAKGLHQEPQFTFECAIEYEAVDCILQVIASGVVAIPQDFMERCVPDWSIQNLDQIYEKLHPHNKPKLKGIVKTATLMSMEWANIEWMLTHFDWSAFTKMDFLVQLKPRVSMTVQLARLFGKDLEYVYDDFTHVRTLNDVDIIRAHFPQWLKRDISRAVFSDGNVYLHCLKFGSFTQRPTIDWFPELDLTPYMTTEAIDACVKKYLRKAHRLTNLKRNWLVKQLLLRHSTPHYHFNIVMKICMLDMGLLNQIVPLLQWNIIDKEMILERLTHLNIKCLRNHLQELLYIAIRLNDKVDVIAQECMKSKLIPEMEQAHLDMYFDELGFEHKVALCRLYPSMCAAYESSDIGVWTHFLRKRKREIK